MRKPPISRRLYTGSYEQGPTFGTSCTVYTLFNPFVQQAHQKPRVIGLQDNYRF